MSDYTEEDLLSISPVLGLFKEPTKMMRYSISENPYATLNRFISHDPTIDKDSRNASYYLLNNLLINVVFKLKTIYHDWSRGELSLTENEIKRITIGINYEIVEAHLHAIRLGSIYLPYISHDRSIVRRCETLTRAYIGKCHLTFPKEFALGTPESAYADVNDESKKQLAAGTALPSIRFENTKNLVMGTSFSYEEINERIAYAGNVNSVYPSISKILKMCRVIDQTLTMLEPERFPYANDRDIQLALLSFMFAIREWDEITVSQLLMDNKVLRDRFEQLSNTTVNGKATKIALPFTAWREAQFIDILSPNIHTTSTLC